jgi:hypothetical protein
MEQSPSCEANSHSANQETPCLLWNPKVYYSVHKGAPLAPTLSQINPIYTLPFYFPKIYSNNFLSLSLALPSGLFLSGFPTEIFYTSLISPMNATCPTHLLLDLITPITFGKAC